MATPVTMPVLGLTMEEGTVAEWLKAEGDTVAKDEPLLTVEMDKGTVEVPSPASGVLRRIVVQPGTTVPVRTLIAEIAAPGESLAEPAAAPPAAGGGPSLAGSAGTPPASAVAAAPAPAGAAGGPGDLAPSQQPSPVGAPSWSEQAAGSSTAEATRLAGGPGDLPPIEPSPADLSAATASRPTRQAGGSAVAVAGDGSRGQRRFASPRARLRARELGIDLLVVVGSGPNGRIVEDDVLLAAQAGPVAAVGADAAGAETRVLATPLARRLALEHGVLMSEIRGTGPGGRIIQDDVLRAAEQRALAPAAQAVPPMAGLTTIGAGGEVQPLSRVRRITAERMAASARSIARVTLFADIDFSEARRFRQQLAPEFTRLGVPKLPWDALLAKAVGLALAEHRHVAAQWVDGAGLRLPDGPHVGIAVALEPEGLVVPVLRDADRRSLRELAADLLGLADRARQNRLSPAEMQGGAFTITNLGQYRVDGFTPIVNPPETAILGVGRIADRAVVVDGRVEVRSLCTLSLSFDHRVVDGAPAAAFMTRLAELLERPYALLGL